MIISPAARARTTRQRRATHLTVGPSRTVTILRTLANGSARKLILQSSIGHTGVGRQSVNVLWQCAIRWRPRICLLSISHSATRVRDRPA